MQLRNHMTVNEAGRYDISRIIIIYLEKYEEEKPTQAQARPV